MITYQLLNEIEHTARSATKNRKLIEAYYATC